MRDSVTTVSETAVNVGRQKGFCSEAQRNINNFRGWERIQLQNRMQVGIYSEQQEES